MRYHSRIDQTIGSEPANRYATRLRRQVGPRRADAATPSRKPRDAAELLAKIDAIYHELSLQNPPRLRRADAATLPVESQKPAALVFIGLLIAGLIAGEIWLYYDRPDTGARTPAAEIPFQTAAETAATAPTAEPSPRPPTVLTQPPAAQPPIFDNVKKARVDAEKQAENRRIAQARRRARAEEEARLARQQEAVWRAAEARRAAAAVPPPAKRPASPEELCADQGNFFARNFCEARACQQAEWQNHPTCVRHSQYPIPGGS